MGNQVEFEQIIQTVSLALQTQIQFEHFYLVPYLLVPCIYSPEVFRPLQPTRTGSRTPWDKTPQYPVQFVCPIFKQVAVYLQYVIVKCHFVSFFVHAKALRQTARWLKCNFCFYSVYLIEFLLVVLSIILKSHSRFQLYNSIPEFKTVDKNPLLLSWGCSRTGSIRLSIFRVRRLSFLVNSQ